MVAQTPTGKATLTLRLTLALLAVATPARVTAQQTEAQASANSGRIPGLVVNVSADYLNTAEGGAVAESSSVREKKNGMHVLVVAQTTGRVQVNLLPCDHRAVICVRMLGTACAEMLGTRPRLELDARSSTALHLLQELWLDRHGFSAPAPPQAHAATHICLNHVYTGYPCLRDCLVKGVARSAFHMTRRSLERSASDYARTSLEARTAQQVGEKLRDVNTSFSEQLRKLGDLGVDLTSLHFSTTRDELWMAAWARAGKPATLPAPPGTPIGVRLHDGFVNDALLSAFPTGTISGADLEKSARPFLKLLGVSLQPDPDQAPWTITFAKKNPLRVKFANGQMILVLRSEEFTSADKEVSAMDITVRYTLRQTPEGVRAVRDQELEIYPPGFVPGSGKRLSARQLATRTMLRRRFGRMLPPSFSLDTAALSPRGQRTGALQVTHFAVVEGWLVLGYRHHAAGKVAAHP
jgi:hypothetical protein